MTHHMSEFLEIRGLLRFRSASLHVPAGLAAYTAYPFRRRASKHAFAVVCKVQGSKSAGFLTRRSSATVEYCHDSKTINHTAVPETGISTGRGSVLTASQAGNMLRKLGWIQSLPA